MRPLSATEREHLNDCLSKLVCRVLTEDLELNKATAIVLEHLIRSHGANLMEAKVAFSSIMGAALTTNAVALMDIEEKVNVFITDTDRKVKEHVDDIIKSLTHE